MARAGRRDRGVYEETSFHETRVAVEGVADCKHLWRLEEAESGIVTRTCRRCQRQVVGRVEHSGIWWIRWTCQFGHEHQERVGPKGLAIAKVEQRRVDAKVKAFCLTRDRDRQRREKLVLFSAVADKYEAWAEEHRPRSLTFRVKALLHLRKAFGRKALTEITAEDLDQYQAERQEQKAAGATVNRELSVLSHLFRVAIKTWKLAKFNPVTGIERLEEADEKPRPMTPEEEEALLPVLPAHYMPFVTLDLNTGLRLGELRYQLWRDIDLPGATLHVTRPKSKKPESIPLNSVAITVLRSLERTSPLVFPKLPKKLTDLFIRYVAKANLPRDITFSCLRDTYISRLAEHVSTPVLMALARHRDYRTTRRYIRVDGDHLRAAVEQLIVTSAVTEKLTVSQLLQNCEVIEGVE